MAFCFNPRSYILAVANAEDNAKSASVASFSTPPMDFAQKSAVALNMTSTAALASHTLSTIETRNKNAVLSTKAQPGGPTIIVDGDGKEVNFKGIGW